MSTGGDILPRSAGTFTTVDEARQYLARVRSVWLDGKDRWAVFKLPPEMGRGALVASGIGNDLTARNRRVAEPDPS